MAVLKVKMFGAPSVEMDGRPAAFPYRKSEALFYYMVLKKRAARSELVGLLWATSDSATALKNLRHAVYTIRKELGSGIFVPGQRIMLELNPEVELHCDVLDFLERGSLESYGGDFLKGFSVRPAGLFEEWQIEQRNLLYTQYLKRLLAAEQEALQAGDLLQAEQYGLKYMALDPLEESAAVALMEVYSAQKKFRRAVGVYHTLCHNLSAELSVTPLKETTALYYQIVNEWNSSTDGLEERSGQLVVGKDEALHKLLAICSRSGEERGAPCALLEGEAGVGKTYLLDHILGQYDFSDRLVCRCCCYQTESGVSLAPWNSIMLALTSEIEARGIAIPENYLKTAATLFPCLSANMERNLTETDVGYAMRTGYPVARERALLILSAVAKKAPLLLVFEDIHWMDKNSADMLALFLRRLRDLNVTVICTSRDAYPSYIKDFLENAQRDNIIARYRIQCFSGEETGRFVRHYLGGAISEKLVEQMFQATGGNALLLVQLMNSMQETRNADGLPQDLGNVISYRLANLTQEEHRLLDVASVFTEWVELDLLAAVMGVDPLDLIYQCGRLKQKMLILDREQEGKLYYALAHEQIKAVLVQQQPEAVRRMLNLRVAQYMEARWKQRGERHYERLAHHFELGGDRFKAFQYRVLALNAYTDLYYTLLPTLEDSNSTQSEEEGLPHYFQRLEGELASLRAAGADREQLNYLELILLYAKSCYCIYNGLYPAGLTTLRRLMSLCGMTGDRDMEVRAHLQYIYYGVQIHAADVMEHHLNAAFQLLKGREQSLEYGICLRLSGLLFTMSGEYDQARARFQYAIQSFQSLDSGSDGRYDINIAGVYNYIAETYRLERNFDEAFHYYDQAIIYNKSKGFYPGAAMFYTNYGMAAFQRGEHLAARDMFQSAMEIYHSSHEYNGRAIALSYLALYDAEDGIYDGLAGRFKEALGICDLIGSPWWKGITLYLLWRVRCILEKRGVQRPELSLLWPASHREHCQWALSYLDRLAPCLESEELRAEAARLEREEQLNGPEARP